MTLLTNDVSSVLNELTNLGLETLRDYANSSHNLLDQLLKVNTNINAYVHFLKST